MSKKKIIKKITQELFKKMTFKDAIVEVEKQKKSSALMINVQVKRANRLIGQSGSNLKDLQKILRILIAKKIPEPPLFLLDINNYREQREEFLKGLAKELAEQVVENKKSVMLQPMSSYERRIIHLELAENKEVATESIGQEPVRRVVINPYE